MVIDNNKVGYPEDSWASR